MFGGFLLGTAAAGTAALGAPAYLRHIADDVEGLFMRLALGTVYAVPREGEATRLQILLQTCLCILERSRGRKRRHPGLEEPLDDFLGSLEASVEKHSAADGLERVREDGLAAETPGFQLAGAELQHLTQADLRGYFRQRPEFEIQISMQIFPK